MSSVPFDINLIRDRVIPRRQRKSLFLVMSLYVLVSGVVMALVTYRSALRFNDARLLSGRSKGLERQFQADYPEQRDMVAFARKGRVALDQEASLLEGVGGVLSRHVPLHHVLRGLQLPLPYMTHVTDFSYEAKGRQVSFTITTPARATRALSAGQLLQLWREQPLIAHYLSHITAEQTTRTRQDNESVLAHRFSAKVMRQSKR